MKKNTQNSVLENTKNNPGLVATGMVLGSVVGTTSGYVVSQVAGTPVVPSLVIGGAAGGAIGTGAGVYMASKIGEAREDAILESETMIARALDGRPLRNGDAFAESLASALVSELGDKAKNAVPAVVSQVRKEMAKSTN
jgi:putative Ca2+/H+ antiporter (TMEM165/GDT1 family)